MKMPFRKTKLADDEPQFGEAAAKCQTEGQQYDCIQSMVGSVKNSRRILGALGRTFLPLLIFAILPVLFGAESPDPLGVAVNHLHNLEFADAQKELEAWLAQHPEDLRAWNYLGQDLLQRELYRRELLGADAYGRGGRAFQDEVVNASPEFKSRMQEILEKAETLAQARLKRNPRDEDALYWIGVTHVTRALYQLTIARAKFKALAEGKEARNYHAKLLEIDPNYEDAYLVVGTYDYILGSIPWYTKVVASLAGYRGDRARGLKEVARAAEHGRWARDDAKTYLATLYYREKRYQDALALLQDLGKSYPRNPLVPQEIARIYKALGDMRRAAETYDSILAKYEAQEPGFLSLPVAKIYYQAGQAHAQLGEKEAALKDFDRAAEREEKNIYVYRAELAAAALCLEMHNRSEALKKYRRVAEAVPNSEEGREAARALKSLQSGGGAGL